MRRRVISFASGMFAIILIAANLTAPEHDGVDGQAERPELILLAFPVAPNINPARRK